MTWWVYKCNSTNQSYQNVFGDWRDFFDKRAANGQVARWGYTSDLPQLEQLRPGDMVFAYQTDRRELVGLVRMVRFEGEEVLFERVEEFAVKLPPLKKADPCIAAIPAFKPGPIRTLYRIEESDAQRLSEAARLAVTNAC